MEANMAESSEGRELQQREGGQPYWNPFSIFSGFMNLWDPFGVLHPSARSQTFAPAFDGRDTEEAYVLEADLPGIEEDDLEMSVTGTQLSVSGKRDSGQRERGGRFFCSERGYGRFTRTFTLPDDAELDRVNAKFQDGVLRVEIPKRSQGRPRRIGVARARDGSSGGQQRSSGRSRRARK
jgi:HSP20 family protein